MCSARRVLSFVLVFVALAACVIPALTPPARAVAVVDDAIVIGVGLMFAGLTGITFSRSDHAVSAIQKFLTDCADVAQQIATLAAESVQDGIFKFTATNKLVYATIVAAMQGYFTSAADETGALRGTISLGATYSPLSCTSFAQVTASDTRLTVEVKHMILSVDGKAYPIAQSMGRFNGNPALVYKFTDPSISSIYSIVMTGANLVSFDLFKTSAGEYGLTCFSLEDGKLVSRSTNFSFKPLSLDKNVPHEVSLQVAGDNVIYLQDAAVNGTSALDQFEQLPEPAPDPDDDDKPVEVPFVPFPIPNELETARRGLNQDADGNPLTDAQGNPLTDADGNPLTQAKPGIVPSERIGTLTDAISQAKPDTPTPDNPNDNPDDERTKRHDADWQNLFPFCIPFDLIEFLGVLAADPVAPKFDWRIYAPNVVDYTLEIDLSPFDSVAKICRTMELLAFCIGLILLTRNIIRG